MLHADFAYFADQGELVAAAAAFKAIPQSLSWRDNETSGIIARMDRTAAAELAITLLSDFDAEEFNDLFYGELFLDLLKVRHVNLLKNVSSLLYQVIY